MMEPMMMMGMIDNSAVGLNYSTNRTAFPPPQAHAVVPNAMSNHLPPQPNPPQNPQPMTSVPASSSSNSKPKKQRKKKSADGMITLKPDDEASRLKKKKSCKPKQKNKPRIKPVDGTVSLLGKKGKTLDAQAREIALNVAEYFKREAELGRTLMPLHSYQKRAAAATGVSTATLRKLEGARREIRSEKVAAECMVDDPFPDLHIADTSFLDTTESRHKCRKCTKSRKYFCYSCCEPMPQIKDKIPRVKLPVVLVFPCSEAKTLKDVMQSASSSTLVSLSASMPLTQTDSGLHTPHPQDQGLHTPGGYADITTSSTYADLQTIWTSAYFQSTGPTPGMQPAATYTYLQTTPMYPSTPDFSTGKPVAESHIQREDKPVRLSVPFERAVFIDCTWNQTKNIIQDERLKDLRRVAIMNYNTQFWRCQEGLPTTFLSTIEAIYYFVREYHEEVLSSPYMNEYDNLLFFFLYFYRKIREKYQGGKELKAYNRKPSV
ncbi:hypothetical protein C0Q70_00611 [Pomacea canaliculata]|uniref:tRNA-uridine aminocarboxypropyltransferase 1 n=1 Tax=Pomacea canaliculata TaxID=400727 RepID=A0A2T7PX49_POMCA|nr:hypothetical protein C0Q70_00611 [Pomacea canaliculata]